MPLRITTWNVNGIRNPFGHQPWRDRRTFGAMFDILEADIVVMQELKIQKKDLRDDMVLVEGWDCFFSLPKHKKGYSGVGIYTRKAKCSPVRAEEGLLGVLCPPNSEIPYYQMNGDNCIGGYPSIHQLNEVGIEVDSKALDSEGRCVVIEFPAFVLFGIYSPANSNGLRDDFRHNFICAMDLRIRNLIRMGRRVIVTGDLNVSREPMDTACALDDGMTVNEYVSSPNRRIFNQLLEGGRVVEPRDVGREEPVLWDVCRGFHETREGMFTHWEVKINARPANYGSRIDFVLCSLDLKSWIIGADIQAGLMGSDHCPVYAIIEDEIDIDGNPTKLCDVMNPHGMFVGGLRTREINGGDIPSFSARLMPEFDKRRNIKDMFALSSGASLQIPATKPPNLSTSQPSQPTLSAPKDRNTSDGDMGNPAKSSATMKRSAHVAVQDRVSKHPKLTPHTINKSIPKGQMSMKTFFVKKGSPSTEKSSDFPVTEILRPPMVGRFTSNPSSVTAGSICPSSSPTQSEREHSIEGVKATISTPTTASAGTGVSSSKISQASECGVTDPIATKESWNKLFTKKLPPRCKGHQEPCQSFKTGKKGANQGREFWLCSRPLGPSGIEEHGSEWRCSTFIWASDWNGSRV